jgi:hypothetical protein
MEELKSASEYKYSWKEKKNGIGNQWILIISAVTSIVELSELRKQAMYH